MSAIPKLVSCRTQVQAQASSLLHPQASSLLHPQDVSGARRARTEVADAFCEDGASELGPDACRYCRREIWQRNGALCSVPGGRRAQLVRRFHQWMNSLQSAPPPCLGGTRRTGVQVPAPPLTSCDLRHVLVALAALVRQLLPAGSSRLTAPLSSS